MTGRRTNLGLLVVLAIALATGALAYATGTTWVRWVVVAHGASGVAVVVLAPWKSVIAKRGLRRRQAGSAASVVLGVLVTTTVVSGVLHSAGLRDTGPFTSMQVHVGAALVAVPFALWHVVARPVRVRRADLSRRNLLKAGSLAGASVALWLALEGAFRALAVPGARRRATGSHEVGSFRPAEMPVTQWFDDSVPRVDATAWRLVVRDGSGEREVELAELAAGRDTVTAVLDCTGGWYATQRWEGVRLDRLLDGAGPARSIVVRSVTGYQRRFPTGDARHLLLAVRVGGDDLSRGHGFPVRLVAPGRRGFWWVKWVERVELDGRPWWWQSPFPLT